MFKPRVWVSCILISIIYWGTWFNYENNTILANKSYIKHLLNFGLLASVTIIGTYGWTNHYQVWIKKLWIFVYFSIIAVFFFWGVIDWTFGINNISMRNLLGNLRLFFTSPIPFGILMFLSRKGRTGHFK